MERGIGIVTELLWWVMIGDDCCKSGVMGVLWWEGIPNFSCRDQTFKFETWPIWKAASNTCELGCSCNWTIDKVNKVSSLWEWARPNKTPATYVLELNHEVHCS